MGDTVTHCVLIVLKQCNYFFLCTSCPGNDNHNKVLTKCYSTIFQVASFRVLSAVVFCCDVVLLVWGLVDISNMLSSGPSYDIYGVDNYDYTNIPYYNDYDYYNRRGTYSLNRVYMGDYGVFSWLPRWAYDYDYERYHHFKDDAESHTTLASIL